MKKVRFIHAADLHLDSPMVGLKHLPERIFRKLQESTFSALSKMVDAALMYEVDFVIIAGDIYDGEDRSIRAQTRFRKEMERLAARGIAVYIVHGNHDHLDGSWTHLPMPGNVHLFPHEVKVEKFSKDDGTTVHLYGFSYPKRHLYERMVPFYTKEHGADFHIGILHGSIDGNNEHGKYAPFSLMELLEKGFDYWALGHIHKRNEVCLLPPVVYPGNIQGRNRKETGEKGCYLVDLTESGCERKFIESAAVIWENITLDATQLLSFNDIYNQCRDLLEEKRVNEKATILSVSVKNVSIPEAEYTELLNGELLEILQDEEKDEENFVWISEISIHARTDWKREQLEKESDFFSELFQQSKENDDLAKSIDTLYKHPVARKYLSELTVEERNNLVQDAEDFLVRLLIR